MESKAQPDNAGTLTVAGPFPASTPALEKLSRKGYNVAKMSSWYQVKFSEQGLHHPHLFWQLKPQPLGPGSFGFYWGLLRRWYLCPTSSYNQGSVILGAKIRGACGEQEGSACF